MKENSKKILLWLYREQNLKNYFDKPVLTNSLKEVLPELKETTFRSLINLLYKDGLIDTQKLNKKSYVSITDLGIRTVNRLFPALSENWQDWDGSWECLVFTTAPKGDKQFRFMRKKLIDIGAISVTRGVYFMPNGFSKDFIDLCLKLYKNSVIVFGLSEFVIGINKSHILEKYSIADINNSYSGISKEVEILLNKISNKKTLINQYKINMCSIFDRYYQILSEDSGFVQYFFQSKITAKNILLMINSVLIEN